MDGQVAQSRLPAVPTKERMRVAFANLANDRREAQEAIRLLEPIDIPPDQLVAYYTLLKTAHHLALGLEPRLPILYTLFDDRERSISLICVLQFQQIQFDQGNPRIVVRFEELRAAYEELARLNNACSQATKQAVLMQRQRETSGAAVPAEDGRAEHRFASEPPSDCGPP